MIHSATALPLRFFIFLPACSSSSWVHEFMETIQDSRLHGDIPSNKDSNYFGDSQISKAFSRLHYKLTERLKLGRETEKDAEEEGSVLGNLLLVVILGFQSKLFPEMDHVLKLHVCGELVGEADIFEAKGAASEDALGPAVVNAYGGVAGAVVD
jgi:hypothetical protein